MGPHATARSARRARIRPRPLMAVPVLLIGVVLGLVVHLLGVSNHPAGDRDAHVAASAAGGAVAAAHVDHGSPKALGGLVEAEDRASAVATPSSHGHGEAACGSIPRPAAVTTLDPAGCTGAVGATPRPSDPHERPQATVQGASAVERPSQTPGRQRQ
ncbi:MAG: hypothetical protein ACT4QF_01635 [Sporichthyaceae bacterium]